MSKSIVSPRKLTITAMLIALGILIPVVMPGYRVEPVSFTLASHVPVMLGMMISPAVGLVVAAGTTVGFLFRGVSLIIVLRAASHCIFVLGGSLVLQKYPEILKSAVKTQLFSLAIGVVHSICEVLVVTFFYFNGSLTDAYYDNGFVTTIVLVLGIGSIIHSMVDFAIALVIRRAVCMNAQFKDIFIHD